ncbi:MAG TPA: hypothetical protein VGF55_26380 [Gemmataceae bacterium]|jgi:hypothetical protein
MDALRFVAERGNERFEIIEGSGEGFYVVRYVGNQSTHDYLQDTVLAAQGTAEEFWQVPATAWRVARDGEMPLWKQHKRQ